MEQSADQQIRTWIKERPWFTEDRFLRHVSAAVERALMEQSPNLGLAERLALTEQMMREGFADKMTVCAPHGTA